jgi:hypothetical protein
MLRFQKKLRDLGKVMVATEDRRGLLSYSVAQVWFDGRFFARFPFNESYKERSEDLIAMSLRFVNRFIDAYRDVTRTFWLPVIKRRDLARITFVGIYGDGRQDHLGAGTLGTGIALGSMISNQEDKLIRKILVEGMVFDEIQRSAYVVADLLDKEEYWSAALLAEILFEAKFARILRLAFAAQGLSAADIDAKFEDKKRGMPVAIRKLVRTFIPELTPVSLNDLDNPNHPVGRAFQAWDVKARELRNRIAHGESLSVSGTEAMEAIGAVKDFLAQIQNLLPDRFPTTILV